MSEETVQTGPIAVYGATGYTGRLIAAELAGSDFDFVLAGRNRTKLEALATELGIDVPLHAVSTGDAAGLRKLLEPCSAVIACAGPFYLHGEPILAAAADTGTHYFDTTGEQPFIQLALDQYGPRAAANGSAVMSGMGFDYVPGDMLASLTAAGMGDLDTLRLAYVTKFQPTRGTMLSALEMIKGNDLEWKGGILAPSSPAIGRGSFDFGGTVGKKAMTRYPAGEHITVPRHVKTRRVETMLSADSVTPPPLVRLTPMIMRPAAAAMRTPLKGLVSKVVDRLPEGADPDARAAATWTVGCEAVNGAQTRRGTISGNDVYGLTAALLAKAAGLAATGRLESTGGLAPSQAFNPVEFLSGLERFSVEWSVDPLA